MALLYKLIDWAFSLFRAETLILDDEILVPLREVVPNAPRATVNWETLFQRLDVLMAIEKSTKNSNGGEMLGSHRKFRRRIGSYIYFGGLEDFSEKVEFISELGLPGMFSVAVGGALDILRESPQKVRWSSTINGVLVESKHLPIERMDGSLYEASIVYSSLPRSKRWGKTTKGANFSGRMFFYVHPDGSVSMPRVRGKRQTFVSEMARDHGDSFDEMAQSFCADFARSINAFRQRDANWLVKVDSTSPQRKVTFGIKPLDAPLVFNERMKVKTHTGRTRPIFHPVRVHERVTSSGKTSIVKLHHRGVNKFNWRGYACEIAIPSWNSKAVREASVVPLNDFTIAAPTYTDEEVKAIGGTYYTAAQLARKFG